MTSQISKEQLGARREFWRRCRRLWRTTNGTYVLRDGDASLTIKRWTRSPASSFYTVDLRLKHRGATSHIASSGVSLLSGYWKTVADGLPILRRNMVLDDLVQG